MPAPRKAVIRSVSVLVFAPVIFGGPPLAPGAGKAIAFGDGVAAGVAGGIAGVGGAAGGATAGVGMTELHHRK